MFKERERIEAEKKEASERRKRLAEEKRDERAKAATEKSQQREEAKRVRLEKRKREEEEKAERKRAREERRTGASAIPASSFVCAECGGRGRCEDEENGVNWYGCDRCDSWFHNYCLSVEELTRAAESVSEDSEWVCKMCEPRSYEE